MSLSKKIRDGAKKLVGKQGDKSICPDCSGTTVTTTCSSKNGDKVTVHSVTIKCPACAWQEKVK